MDNPDLSWCPPGENSFEELLSCLHDDGELPSPTLSPEQQASLLTYGNNHSDGKYIFRSNLTKHI